MSWVEPGEFAWGGAVREENRTASERSMLDEILAVGWSEPVAREARRLHDRMTEAVQRAMGPFPNVSYDETALGLVGEARGAHVADWWSRARGLDDDTRALIRQCAQAAAAMALVDGYLLGAEQSAMVTG